jgi:hypothetical protein
MNRIEQSRSEQEDKLNQHMRTAILLIMSIPVN